MLFRMLCLTTVLGLALCASRPATAFVHELDEVAGKPVPVRWPRSALPVTFKRSDRPLSLLPNLATNSLLDPVIQSAMRSWVLPIAPLRLDGTSPRTDLGGDGVNLITFANTPQNRDIGGNFLAVTLPFTFRGREQELAEADILLNPREKFASDGRADATDLEATLAHELGHAVGLDHSPLASATMFPTGAPGETHQRRLELDDLAGLRTLYSETGAIPRDVGALAGRVVTTTGGPVFGAHVLATDTGGIARVGVLTDRDGSYRIPSLPAGDYFLYAEPLDWPVVPDYLSAPYYWNRRFPLQVAFRTTFAGGNASRARLRVTAGRTTSVDPIRVETAPPTLNAEEVAWTRDGEELLYGASAWLRPGEFAALALIGRGVDGAPDSGFTVSGDGLTVDTRNMARRKLSDGTPYVIFGLEVNPGAPPGARNLYVSKGTEVTAYSGAIKVIGN